MEEFGKIVLRNIFFKILNIGYIFLVVKSRNDVYLYALGLTMFLFLSNISLWGYIPRYIKIVKKGDLHPFADIKTVWSLFIPTIAIQVYTVLDKTMIGVITKNSFENGYYEQALKLSKMVLVVVTSLGTVMIPRIGFYFEKKEMDKVKQLMYQGYRFVWFLGIPLCFGLIMVSPNFVPWFFGKGFDKVSILLGVLAFLILAIGINNVTGMQYLIPTKRQNVFTMTVIIGACTNFFMNMILIKRYESIGAAIASVTAETVIAIVQLIVVRKEISPLRVLKEGANYFVAGSLMIVVLFILRKSMQPSIINTMILVIIGAISYILVLVVIRDDFFFSNINTIIDKFKKG